MKTQKGLIEGLNFLALFFIGLVSVILVATVGPLVFFGFIVVLVFRWLKGGK